MVALVTVPKQFKHHMYFSHPEQRKLHRVLQTQNRHRTQVNVVLHHELPFQTCRGWQETELPKEHVYHADKAWTRIRG